MNSEKILIEINVAGVNRSFDCIVPRTMSARLLCRGVLELMEQVQRRVFETTGVRLEPEVRIVR